MGELAAVVDHEYWGDRLEVGTELILAQHADDRYMEAWVERLTPRCRAILMDRFGICPKLGTQDVRQAILARRAELVPFLLVDAATAGKRTYAIVEIARARLPDRQLALGRVRDNEDAFDRLALMWLLYLQDPGNLELVFHLDRTQRKGFARMVLESSPGSKGAGRAGFFAREPLQRILNAYEHDNWTQRESHCAEVLHDGGNYKVFIKRDSTPSFVSRGARNTFGFKREWIILDFEPDLRRVHICSVSPDVPLVLANRIASTYFGEPVEYTNESITTSADDIRAFLSSLLTSPDELPLVELVTRNSGLDGSPRLRLNDPANESLAPAIHQFAAAFGSPLKVIRDIESIKVYAFRKRIKVLFDPVGDKDERLIVRYADQPLNSDQRRAFERMMEEQFGISVMSTEKKYAR